MGAYRRPVKFQRRRVPRRHSKYVGIKPNTTVLFVVIFIIACIIGSVMLGNHLKEKAEQNRPSILDTATQKTDETTKTSSGVSSIGHADGHIRSGCLDISYGTDTESLTKRLHNLFASGFDSVTLPIAANDGALLYYSPVAVTLSYMSADADLPSLTDIVKLIKTVGSEYGINPTVTAYYRLTTPETDDAVLREAAYLFDTAIISEAYTLGADEVLVSGFKKDLHTDERRDAILLFTEKLRISAPSIKVGFAFAPEVYCTDETASNLEKIASEVSFLAVDTSELDWSCSVTEETVYTTDENGDTTEIVETVILSNIYSQIDEITSAAKGSIPLYGLRFVLEGENTVTLREAIDVLYSKGALDFYVMTAPESAYSPSEPETTESESSDETETDEETKRPSQQTKPAETTTQPVDTETDPPVDTETDPPVDTETDPPVDTETDPPVGTETAPPVDTETDPPVDTETDPPVDTETDPPVDTETAPPVDTETEPATDTDTITE